MPRISMAILLGSVLTLGFKAEGTGRIVVANDDWPLSDYGFQLAPDTARFATNVAAWFTQGKQGRFLAYSDQLGLTGTALANAMTNAGHGWTVTTSTPFSVSNLLNFDAVFVGVPTVDNNVLIDYVNAGGSAYLYGAGNGDDPSKWNTFLQVFGLEFMGSGTGAGVFAITNTSHPIFAGVTNLYQNIGAAIGDLTPADPRSQVLTTDTQGNGLYAVWDPGTSQACGHLAIDLYAGISVEGTAGAPYRIQYVSGLEDTNWATLTNLVLRQSRYLIFDPDSPRWANRFYRVQCAAASGLAALGDTLFDGTSDQFQTNSYRPLPAGVRSYQGYGNLAGYTLTETISYGESVAGVAAARAHLASTAPGVQESDFWYARDLQGDMRFLRSMVGGVVVQEASATVTPPLALPTAPLLHQCWPSYVDTEWSVRDLSAATQSFSGLLKVRVVGDDDSIGYNFYQLGVGRVVIQTSIDPAPSGSGWKLTSP